MTQIYGEAGGAAFDELWRSHTSFYLDYVAAAAEGDASGQTQALDGLRQYGTDFSAFLADANPFLDEDGLEALLASHTDHLVSQVSSYVDGDYEAAYTTLREAYEHTESIAAGLAGAIADQFPRLFPDTATAVPTAPWWLRPIGWLLDGRQSQWPWCSLRGVGDERMLFERRMCDRRAFCHSAYGVVLTVVLTGDSVEKYVVPLMPGSLAGQYHH